MVLMLSLTKKLLVHLTTNCVARAVGGALAHDALDFVWLRPSIKSFSYKVPNSIH